MTSSTSPPVAPIVRTSNWYATAQRVLSALTALLLLIAVGAIVLWFWPANYDLLIPARAVPVDSQIAVLGRHLPPAARSPRGAVYMLYVYDESITNKLEQLFGALNADGTLLARPVPTPGNLVPTRDQEQHISTVQMLTSEAVAKIVAWSRLGYHFPERGVEITSVASWSAARASLEPYDVIVEAADRPITSTTQLRELVQQKGVGARIPLVIERAAAVGTTAPTAVAQPCQDLPLYTTKRLSFTVQAVRNPTPPHKAAIGVGIWPFLDISHLPRDPSICINPGNVGGPSAGLAFTLGILERFSATDLTHGRRIAVTGTISVDGTVGAIGGVKQKTIGARWAGAQYFILPADNLAEARPYAHDITLVPVHNVDDALAFLKTVR